MDKLMCNYYKLLVVSFLVLMLVVRYMKNMKRIKYLFLILLISSAYSYTQNIYILGNNNNIYTLDSNDSIDFKCDVTLNVTAALFDIAFLNGILYGITGYGNVFEIDIDNGSSTFITSFPRYYGTPYKSLVGNNQNELYALKNTNGYLYKYNITTQVEELVDIIPYDTPGDITFYKGNLIFPNSNRLKSYDFANSVVSNIYCSYNYATPIFGITNNCQSCENDNTIIIASSFKLYEVNFDAETATELPVSFGFEIYGLASNNEYMATTCNTVLIDKNCNCLFPEEDTIRPVPALAQLPILAEQCSIEELTAPMAVDNCDGDILATTSTSLPISLSTNIIWTYTDDNEIL